ncbi:RNA-binding protein [Alkalispirochaeta sphaeroplastigenens]|uniref:RNA-binding protein n=1 Tax=Alkalispirochaeta sphaeroplastigenens TaxID=1187066 RepID=A0A2S4K1G0_9SPIO|nr:ASCH domain-containing protein [Alkalispirochaeta sphaeroplastigenens]POR05603.1 RNA-binding protein [Alkalispirochaeta sphaeroplastigenens]
MNKHHREYANQYLQLLSREERERIPRITAEHFCNDQYNADECARLVNEGIKRATSSLAGAYRIEGDPFPERGSLLVVLDWHQEPVCIVRITEVSICPFHEVTGEFAAAEGEGDGSYRWWRETHSAVFSQCAQELGIEFNESSEVVLERFEKVYPLSPRTPSFKAARATPR